MTSIDESMAGPPVTDTVSDSSEERVERVRDGLATLAIRVPDADGREVDHQERALLTTLVLSLDQTVRQLEQEVVAAADMDTGSTNGPSGGQRFDLEAAYRADLARRVSELRARLDGAADDVIVLTGGGSPGRGRRFFRGRTPRMAALRPAAPATVGPSVALQVQPLARRLAEAFKDRRRLMSGTGRWLTAVGALVVLLLVFEFWISGLTQARSQRTLLSAFREAVTTGQLDAPNVLRVVGSPVAILRIPSLDVEKVVVEGSSPAELSMGPGHLRGSPLPGEFGNAVIAGRRATYGAPFAHLDELRAGDEIDVTTGQGAFVYHVTERRVIRPGQSDVVGPALDSQLTLITADPRLLATGRLAIVGSLEGNPLGIADRPSVTRAGDEGGLTGDPIGLALALVWGQLLIVAVAIGRRLYRTWSPRAAYLLAAPVVLASLFLFLEGVSRVLPGTL